MRTLDKQQGSYRQVTSSAVKQDLVISAYKPTEALAHRFELGQASPEDAWAFVREHLRNVPVFVGHTNEGDAIAERTAQMLLDRMIAFHVQRGIAIPLSSPEFLQGLQKHFIEREGMYFLPDQITEYDRRRLSVGKLRQLSLFVNDENSAIQWIRQQLQDKPQSFQDLQPQFMRELQAWAKHEKTVELKVMAIAFSARRRAIKRLGLPQVRDFRLAQLDQEEAVWHRELAQRQQGLAELSPLLVVAVVRDGDIDGRST